METEENEKVCYVKVHRQGSKVAVGVCDIGCLGKKFKNGKFQFVVSEAFFGGKQATLDESINILENCDNFNAVGRRIVTELIKRKMIHPEGVVEIEDTPIAIKILF